jgi:hypothetical protein
MNAYAPLDRLFDPENPCLTPEAAERLAGLKEDPATKARTAELAEKANEGALNEAERREYEARVRAGSVFSLLQAKARLFLKSQTMAA